MRTLIHRLRRRDRGQALVEFGLVLPILLLLIFGLVDLGRAVYAQNALSEAAVTERGGDRSQARAGSDIPGIEDYTESRIASVPGVTATAECITTNIVGCSPDERPSG